MVGTSDVIGGSGGGGVAFRNGKEVRRTISANATDFPASAMNGKSDEPIILKSTTAFAKDRLYDGSAVGDYINIMVDPRSENYYLEKTAALPNSGRREIIACLQPGAAGVLEWDGTEWIWSGRGEVWGLVPVAAGADFVDPGTWGNIISAAAYDGGVIVAGVDQGSPAALQVMCVPYDSDGVMSTPGAPVTKAETNAISLAYVYALTNTIFVVVYDETTANNTRAIVVTRSGSTLTMASSSTILESTAANYSQHTQIVPIRAQSSSSTPAFLLVHNISSPDSLYYPEYSYCTIAGTGTIASITRNTGVTFNFANRQVGSSSYFWCVEDPEIDGDFWHWGDDGNANASPQLIRFQISGTTPTKINDYEFSVDAFLVSGGPAKDLVDGHAAFWDASASRLVAASLGANPRQLGMLNIQNLPSSAGPGYQHNNAYRWYGGVFTRQPGIHVMSIGKSYRIRRGALKGPSNIYFAGGSLNGEYADIDMADFTPGDDWDLPESSSTNGIIINTAISAMAARRVPIAEDKSLHITCQMDNLFDTFFRIVLFQVPTATRYKS